MGRLTLRLPRRLNMSSGAQPSGPFVSGGCATGTEGRTGCTDCLLRLYQYTIELARAGLYTIPQTDSRVHQLTGGESPTWKRSAASR